MTSFRVTLVVPCFNEAARLRVEAFERFMAEHAIDLLFVDDGSSDDTAAVVAALVERAAPRAALHRLAHNAGKGEAVRAGMREAIARGAELVGYVDADLATPLDEVQRLVGLFDDNEGDEVAVVTAARVALHGTRIERTAFRHYAGRLFATCAALTLRARYYDTQCGAKLFRVLPALEDALATPFASPWLFDVELLGRLLTGPHRLAPERIREAPLRAWRDVAGSRLHPGVFLRAPYELARIATTLARRRRTHR